MTGKERNAWRALNEFVQSLTGPMELERNHELQDCIDALLEDDDDQPTRPRVGTQFWMRGASEPKWWVWTACEDGIETVDEGGLLNDGYSWSWATFDGQIEGGLWIWQPLEQPEEV